MKSIMHFQATDGKIFPTSEECMKYENIIQQVDDIMKDFPRIIEDDNSNFANGGGYIQHEKIYVDRARHEITKLGNELFKISPPTSFGWIGRWFDDSGYICLYSAWGRLSHIDDKYREWGQGYYAANPHEGKQIKLN